MADSRERLLLLAKAKLKLRGQTQAEQAPSTPPEKPPAIDGAASRAFPNFSREYDARMTRPAGSIGQSVKDFGALGMAGLGDLSSYEQRVMGSLFGGTDFSDPEGGYRKATRQEYGNWYDDRIRGIEEENGRGLLTSAKQFPLKLGRLASTGAVSFTEAPITTIATLGGLVPAALSGARGLLAKGVPAAKDAALRFGSLKGEMAAVERAATPAGRQELARAARVESPDAMAGEVLQDIRTANTGEQMATAAAEARRQQRLDQAVPTAQDPYFRGKQIQASATEGKQTLGRLFQEEQDRVLKETGVANKTLRWKKEKGYSGLSSTSNGLENPLQRSVVDYLDEIKYDPFKGYGVVGNRVIEPGAINELKSIYHQVGKARTTQDALEMRRLIDNRINFGGEGNTRLFAKGSDSDFALTSVRDRINGVIEKQFSRAIKDPKEAEALSKAWRANNEHYASVSDTLGEAADKLGGKNAEQYIGAIQSIGVDRLKGVFASAAKHPELSAVAKDLKDGYLDNMIHRASKDGHIDFAGMKKLFNAPESQALNEIMLTPAQRARIQFALNKFEKTRFPEAKEVGKFFEGGRSDLKTASDQLANISTYDKRFALKELEFLDALNGRFGDKAIAPRALAMSQARRLGMDEAGRLPLLPNIFTGKFGIGGTPGALLQSPAGTVFAFRALNALERGARSGLPGLTSLSKRAASTFPARVVAADASQVPNAIPFRKVAENDSQSPVAMRK